MHAAQIDRFGGPEVLNFREVAVPEPSDRGVLVRIVAASVNPVDIKVRRGEHPYVRGVALPLTIGRDFSGVIERVGIAVTDFHVGEEVFGVSVRGVEGGYAEAIAIDAELVYRKPANLSHAETTASALTGLTAMTALKDGAQLRAGETVLIHGASGGVGTMAIQLARNLGAVTIAHCNPQKADAMRHIGADVVLPYGAPAPPCDAILDLVGNISADIVDRLKAGGRLLCLASSRTGSGYSSGCMTSGHQAIKPKVRRSAESLSRLVDLIEAGNVQAPTIHPMPLAEASRAHQLFEARANLGKIVFEIG